MEIDYSSANVFVHNGFDRLAEKRCDTPWIRSALADPTTCFVLVWQNRCPLQQEQLRLATSDELNGTDLESAILVGKVDGQTCFALDLGEQELPPAPFNDWSFHGLRTLGTVLADEPAALVAFAQAMVFWHRRHRHCGQCGATTVTRECGHALECTQKSCKSRTFPRSDPAVIVASTHGDKILLGRQASWPAGRYSTIAGFVEPGESLEMAVRREVAEETGHRVDKVEYVSSQPWPFPASLMLGFTATISAEAITEPDEELEDVRWFSRAEIVQRETVGPKLLPPKISISYRLIERWFDSGTEQPLAEQLASSGS